jgi:hypothetical protein
VAAVAAKTATADDDDEPLAEPPAKSESALQKARNLSNAPAPLPLRDRKKELTRKTKARRR